MNPRAIVAAVGAGDRRDLLGGVVLAALAAAAFGAPAFLDRVEEAHLETLGVGEDEIEIAVAIEVRQPRAFRRVALGKGDPGRIRLRDGVDPAIVNQFADAVAVEIAKRRVELEPECIGVPQHPAAFSVEVVQANGPGLLSRGQHASETILPKDAKPRRNLVESCRERRVLPRLPLRVPDPRLAHLVIADDHVHVTIVVQIEHPHAVVATVRFAQRLA